MDVLAIVGTAMQNDLQRLTSISQNLANISTSGYQREIPLQRPFDSYVQDAMAAGGMQAPGMVRDTRAGTLRASGSPLDIALEGDGYFEVMTDKGPAYTRQGHLRIDARGRLVTVQGAALMGVSGELSVTNAPLTIRDNGEIQQEGRLVGQIRVQRFANPTELTTLGNGLFGQGGARVADAGQTGKVRAGYQENANVNSAQEMVHLTETVRHYEALQKLMQGHDEVVGKALHKLGEF